MGFDRQVMESRTVKTRIGAHTDLEVKEMHTLTKESVRGRWTVTLALKIALNG
jgi:hypothetical protein